MPSNKNYVHASLKDDVTTEVDDEIFYQRERPLIPPENNDPSFYIPPKHHIGCQQNFTDCSNVFKAFIGSNVIGLPFAVSQAGIGLTIIGVLVIAVVTDHCSAMIVKCKSMVIENIRKERVTQGIDAETISEEVARLGKTLSFGQIGKACLGRRGVLAVNISVVFTQFGFTIGYFIFMGNTLRAILRYFLIPKEQSYHNVTTPIVPLNYTTTPLPVTMTSTFSTNSSNSSAALFGSVIDFGLVNSSTLFSFLHHHIDHLRDSVENPFSPSNLINNTTLTFGVLILFPLPILIGIAFVRNLRNLGPISFIANASFTGVGIATAIYMLATMKKIPDNLEWFKFSTFPIFFGQVTAAFEGNGTVIPVEGSMAENRPKYPVFLHVTMGLMAVILSGFGITGYLTYGEQTCQIVTQNLRGDMAIVLQVFLFIGVMFTYPLQIYPNSHIVEHLFVKFRRWNVGRERRSKIMQRAVDQESLIDSQEEDVKTEVKIVKLKNWEGNIIRAILVIFTAACALAFRSQFAYISALTGSIGCSTLSFILPPMFDLSLRMHKMSRAVRFKNMFLMVFGVVVGLMGLYVTMQAMVESFKKGHQTHC